MSESGAILTSYQVEDFLSAENLDRADTVVTEIFKMMFDFDIQAADLPGAACLLPKIDERTAIVGFSGAMRGSCQIRVSVSGAQSIASAMLGGVPIEDDDDSINDALGELCNMLAGGWKNGVPSLSAACALSPPTVISGHAYRVHMPKPSARLSRRYQFETHVLNLTLIRENAESAGE